MIDINSITSELKYKKYVFLIYVFIIVFFGTNCFTFFMEHDVIISIIFWVFLLIWVYAIVNRSRKKRKSVRNLVYFAPPKSYSAAEVATLDVWWPTGRVFPSMLYDWVAKGNVKLGKDKKGEYYFEKISNSPLLDSDIRLVYGDYASYNRDPEHDFWQLCFWRRNIVYLKNISRLPDLDRLPWDFFYGMERECLDWNAYTRGKKHIFSRNWAYIFFSSVMFFAFFLSFLFQWIFAFLLWVACMIRIFSLYVDSKRGSKYYYLNDKGVQLLEEVRGFKKYLLAVDENKVKVLLKEDPLYFEKTLPYAVAYGIGDVWVGKFFKYLKYDSFWGLTLTAEKFQQEDKALQMNLKNLLDIMRQMEDFLNMKKKYDDPVYL